ATYGTIEPIDADTCRLEIGADNPRGLTFLLGALDTDFDIERGPELTEHLRRIAARYSRAISVAPE
ncbi:transcriptional regulator, partial [Nocardia sp. NPDC060220]